MSDSYHITKSSKLKEKGPKHICTYVGQQCFGIFALEYLCSALTYDVMKSYLLCAETRKFIMALLLLNQGFLYDKMSYRWLK